MRLVERMRSGDNGAFEEFGERYTRALLRFACSRLGGDRDLARETVQSTFTKALARLDSYRGEASLLTWLCACWRNELLMHLRARRSEPHDALRAEPDERLAEEAAARWRRPSDPESEAMRGEEADHVHVVLDALPEHYARALEWKYVERLPVGEIAARLGTGEKAAESLLGRARRAFRVNYEALQKERRWSEPTTV
jgi:RNA polymerase sigma-70 factor (ECF subfamily)